MKILRVAKPKVVLIAGSAHGGTTILNMVLGQHPEIFATGKLRGFPHGSLFTEDNVCSCGASAQTCPFWSEIREQYRPIQAMPDQQKLPRLFEIISRVSGLPFVCDVSHNVEYAQQLANTSGIDLYLVHVIRDGRGIVHSRIRKDYRIGRLKSSSSLVSKGYLRCPDAGCGNAGNLPGWKRDWAAKLSTFSMRSYAGILMLHCDQSETVLAWTLMKLEKVWVTGNHSNGFRISSVTTRY